MQMSSCPSCKEIFDLIPSDNKNSDPKFLSHRRYANPVSSSLALPRNTNDVLIFKILARSELIKAEKY